MEQRSGEGKKVTKGAVGVPTQVWGFLIPTPYSVHSENTGNLRKVPDPEAKLHTQVTVLNTSHPPGRHLERTVTHNHQPECHRSNQRQNKSEKG